MSTVYFPNEQEYCENFHLKRFYKAPLDLLAPPLETL